MRVVRQIEQLTPNRPTAMTIGAFDGVHLGHAFLFRQLSESADRARAATLAITFDPDPSEVIRGVPAEYLTSLDEKIPLLEQHGLDELCVVHFDRRVADMTAEDFMQTIRAHANVVELLIGHDFAMGHDRQGTRDVLSAYCQRHDIAFLASAPFTIEGVTVSATLIRRLLAEGNIEQAARLLGRNPSLSGRVVRGDQRGRLLGFATANLGMDIHRALPADGIYVAYTHVAGQKLPSAVNVGVRPTFDARDRTVESYILDFDEDIYGQRIAIEFLHRLRAEEKFGSVEALKQQMARDVAQVRGYFSEAMRS